MQNSLFWIETSVTLSEACGLGASPLQGLMLWETAIPQGKKPEPTVLQNIRIPLWESWASSTPLKVALLYFDVCIM